MKGTRKNHLFILNNIGDEELKRIKNNAHSELLNPSKPLVSYENQLCQSIVRGFLTFLNKNGYEITKKDDSE